MLITAFDPKLKPNQIIKVDGDQVYNTTNYNLREDINKLEKRISLFAQQLEEKLGIEDKPHILGLLIKHPPIEA